MSTKLIEFQYHTTIVGNKVQVFFNRIATCLWRYGSTAHAPGFSVCGSAIPRCAYQWVCCRPVPIAVKEFKTAAAAPGGCPASSGDIAKLPVELSHCVCGKLLVLGRKVLPIAAYLPAAHLERFGITHIARMQDV